MQVFKTVKEIQIYFINSKPKSIGFVPTMGALHVGHISLINVSKKQNNITVCSIFVNPKQFNNPEDLIKYPRNIDADLEKLANANCDVVFVPSVEEMYPNKIEKEYNFGILSTVMEGEHRPGHFNGVAIVIERLFDIIKPNKAYFGEKDFQQLSVIKELVKQLKLPIKIIGCPIIREDNGLAMSSRNERLTKIEHNAASEINKALKYVSQNKNNYSVLELKKYFNNYLSKNKLLTTEYFEIADGNSLTPINHWNETEYLIAFTAVMVGGVRLIDNMTIIN
ncbi:MAG: pantoate--beta-alanine ligase [Flavobacteriales bacterium CG_4_10_14_0_2_um_filter_32_8]|nr:MAG: pantoate--beta-alanine ligase [Bacteroidetes bacterium CG2_30_32_10]PJA06662.1 MAG: pantoate--beta-alanine ligase [Flavobacteriales bacterium CG_4_10_14_0_2_um_filter_32_8]PJB13892.1 MAG: pantoate--beta-alanine ligase [Flavobacteriales bacterium CG_4_9_14_3_um_filter_32_8]